MLRSSESISANISHRAAVRAVAQYRRTRAVIDMARAFPIQASTTIVEPAGRAGRRYTPVCSTRSSIFSAIVYAQTIAYGRTCGQRGETGAAPALLRPPGGCVQCAAHPGGERRRLARGAGGVP